MLLHILYSWAKNITKLLFDTSTHIKGLGVTHSNNISTKLQIPFDKEKVSLHAALNLNRVSF